MSAGFLFISAASEARDHVVAAYGSGCSYFHRSLVGFATAQICSGVYRIVVKNKPAIAAARHTTAKYIHIFADVSSVVNTTRSSWDDIFQVQTKTVIIIKGMKTNQTP